MTATLVPLAAYRRVACMLAVAADRSVEVRGRILLPQAEVAVGAPSVGGKVAAPEQPAAEAEERLPSAHNSDTHPLMVELPCRKWGKSK